MVEWECDTNILSISIDLPVFQQIAGADRVGNRANIEG